MPAPGWLPLVTTPLIRSIPPVTRPVTALPQPCSLSQFGDAQTFTLTTAGQPSETYTAISQARADGDNARVWGGMHYPSTVAVSDAVGEAIADFVNESSMRSLRGEDDEGPIVGDD